MTTKFTGCDELREWLTDNGFRIHRNGFCDGINECNWCAYRPIELEARECECNEGKKIQLEVKPYQHRHHDARKRKWESAEVNVTGEAGDMWFELNCYNLPHDVLRERLPDIERMLVSAWNAMEVRK